MASVAGGAVAGGAVAAAAARGPRDATAPSHSSNLVGSVRRGASPSSPGDVQEAQPRPRATSDGGTDHKRGRISHACACRDYRALRELAASHGGLIGDDVRRTAWPILLGCAGSPEEGAVSDWHRMNPHRDEDQVRLDVDRSFVYYPENETDRQRDARKHDLSRVITAVLRRHPVLHYFQGYHDIVQVLLLVLGAEAAPPAVARLSLLRIRDFMLPTMVGTEPHLHLLPAVLHAADPALCQHLSHTQPFFALAATLTLYAHDIEEYGDIARLFDFLLAHEAVVPVYLFAVVVMSRKAELLDIPADEPEMLHSILSKLPKPLDLEALIQKTRTLFEDYPPERLPGRVWSRVSSSSVLKTTRDFERLSSQTLQEGESFFAQSAAEIQRREVAKARKERVRALARRYRRPLTWTIAAGVVAVLGLYMGRYDRPVWAWDWSRTVTLLRQTAAEACHRFM